MSILTQIIYIYILWRLYTESITLVINLVSITWCRRCLIGEMLPPTGVAPYMQLDYLRHDYIAGFTQKYCTLSQHTKVLQSAIHHNDALGIVYMLYYKLTALNRPIHRKIRTKTNPIQTAYRWMRHIEAPWSLSNNLWVETMLKNKSVINVRPVSVGIYDLLTSQVAYFPHLPQLLAPGSQLASPLQILACNWRCFTVNWTTLHTTGLADMAPATPSHGPGLQLSHCGYD